MLLLPIAVPTTDGYDVAGLMMSVNRYGSGRRQQADFDATAGPSLVPDARVYRQLRGGGRWIGGRGRQHGHVVHHVLVMVFGYGRVLVVVVVVVQLMQLVIGHGRRRVQMQVYLVLVDRRVQVRV